MCEQRWILVIAVGATVFSGSLSASQTTERQSLEGPRKAGTQKSVIMVRSIKQDFDYVSPWKQQETRQVIGSGFLITGKKIITNAHNVSNCRYIELKKENIAKWYPARVTFIGHDCDLAILTTDDESFFDDTIPLELAGIPKVNSTVSTYGFPVGGNRISVTEGVVSRIETDTYVHSGADAHLVIQTDAAINPGNSGGPVMQNGKVVGLAFQGMRTAENIGYMIPTTVIRHFLVDIEDGEYDGFGSLGVLLYPGLHSPSYKDYLKVPPHEAPRDERRGTRDERRETSDDYNVDNDGLVTPHQLSCGKRDSSAFDMNGSR